MQTYLFLCTLIRNYVLRATFTATGCGDACVADATDRLMRYHSSLLTDYLLTASIQMI